MRYYLIAGEASGDLHGAGLVRELMHQDNQAICQCWGGELMADAGAELLKHYRELAFMGFVEVIKNLPTIVRNMKACKQQIIDFQPDAIILIDYPGFNLRIASWAKEAGFRVYYYISPQIWAWHRSRVHQVKRWVDRMYVILPFEQAFYARYGVEVDFVGHPLLDVVADWQISPAFRETNALDEKPIIALLPGSRRQEIEKILPVMAAVATDFPGYQFVVAAAPAQALHFYHQVLDKALAKGPAADWRHKETGNITIVQGKTYDLLSQARAALVGSGTATLETALFGVPEVVCYVGSPLSYAIARQLVDIKYISLVNLVMDQEVVVELIQTAYTPARLSRELSAILSESGQAKLRASYAELREKLGQKGAARRTAAGIIARTREA